MGYVSEESRSAGQLLLLRMYEPTAMIGGSYEYHRFRGTHILGRGSSVKTRSPKCPDSPYRHTTAILGETCRKNIILVISRN